MSTAAPPEGRLAVPLDLHTAPPIVGRVLRPRHMLTVARDLVDLVGGDRVVALAAVDPVLDAVTGLDRVVAAPPAVGVAAPAARGPAVSGGAGDVVLAHPPGHDAVPPARA